MEPQRARPGDVFTRIGRELPPLEKSDEGWNVRVATKGRELVATPNRRYWTTDEWQLSGTVHGDLGGQVGSPSEGQLGVDFRQSCVDGSRIASGELSV